MTNQEIIQALNEFMEAEPNMSNEEYQVELKNIADKIGVRKQDIDDAIGAIENGVGEAYALRGIETAKKRISTTGR